LRFRTAKSQVCDAAAYPLRDYPLRDYPLRVLSPTRGVQEKKSHSIPRMQGVQEKKSDAGLKIYLNNKILISELNIIFFYYLTFLIVK
jgi:hypothetical protein